MNTFTLGYHVMDVVVLVPRNLWTGSDKIRLDQIMQGPGRKSDAGAEMRMGTRNYR